MGTLKTSFIRGDNGSMCFVVEGYDKKLLDLARFVLNKISREHNRWGKYSLAFWSDNEREAISIVDPSDEELKDVSDRFDKLLRELAQVTACRTYEVVVSEKTPARDNN